MERLSTGWLCRRSRLLIATNRFVFLLILLAAAGSLRADDMILPTLAQHVPESGETDALPTFDDGSSQVVMHQQAATPVDQRIAELCQTGSLLFSRGDCLVVKACTGSRFTHVAAIVKEGESCWVYDSMNGTGVRKLALADYLDQQAPDALTLYHPQRPFTPAETRDFQAALEEELGREYDSLHYVTGVESKGIHCAEYLTSVLMSIDWLSARNPVRVSPGSLMEGAETCGAYVAGEELLISRPLEPIPEVSTWQAALWQNTKLCCSATSRQLSRWVLCR